MKYTDTYGDTYELRFRRFVDGTYEYNHGIEFMAGREPYAYIEFYPSPFVEGRHEKPHPYMLWARGKDEIRICQMLEDEGKLRFTGRKTDIYGECYEVEPCADWLRSLPLVTY